MNCYALLSDVTREEAMGSKSRRVVRNEESHTCKFNMEHFNFSQVEIIKPC